MQNLVSLSIDKLRLQVPTFSLAVLKDLYVRIIQWKRNFSDKVEVSTYLEMLRKEAIIHRELTRRKLTASAEFRDWRNNLQNYMTRDGRIIHYGVKK